MMILYQKYVKTVIFYALLAQIQTLIVINAKETELMHQLAFVLIILMRTIYHFYVQIARINAKLV